MSSQSFPSAQLIYEMPGPLTPLLVRVVPSLKIRVQAGYKVRERMRAQVRMWGGRHTLLWGIFVYCCDVEVMWRVWCGAVRGCTHKGMWLRADVWVGQMVSSIAFKVLTIMSLRGFSRFRNILVVDWFRACSGAFIFEGDFFNVWQNRIHEPLSHAGRAESTLSSARLRKWRAHEPRPQARARRLLSAAHLAHAWPENRRGKRNSSQLAVLEAPSFDGRSICANTALSAGIGSSRGEGSRSESRRRS